MKYCLVFSFGERVQQKQNSSFYTNTFDQLYTLRLNKRKYVRRTVFGIKECKE